MSMESSCDAPPASSGDADVAATPSKGSKKRRKKQGEMESGASSRGPPAGAASVGRLDPLEWELRKLLPKRMSTQPNDVYITQRTDFQAQMKRCEKLLDYGGYEEIWIHGLGMAINRAINLSLQLKRRMMGSLEVDTKTDTVVVTDELAPLLDDQEGMRTRSRNCSAIHIRLFRPSVPVEDY